MSREWSTTGWTELGEIDPCFLDRSALPSGFFELYFKLNGEFTWAVTVTSRVVNSWVGETASAWACSIAIYPLCDHLRMTINLGGSSAVARRASEQPTGVMSQLSNQSQIQLQT